MSHHLELNSKNSIFIKNQSYYLQSDSYVINELYRFGGINSIRGFNENSLDIEKNISIERRTPAYSMLGLFGDIT